MPWKMKRTIGGITVTHEDGRLVATVHQEAYAPQIAATPDLYEALDKLTDVCVCVPMELNAEWLKDLEQAVLNGMAAIRKAREG